MSASKEMFLRMRESDFNALQNDIRGLFTYVEVREENEYETHKDDVHYQALYKAQKKARNDLQEYLFTKRHKL